MPGEESRDARDWLRYAREDLTSAEAALGVQSFALRHVCHLAQQAAEKALKAALLFTGPEPPRHHNLDALRNLLPEDWSVRNEHSDLAGLTIWSIESRYPTDLPDPTPAQAREALTEARAPVECVVQDLRAHGFEPETPDA